MVAGLGTEDLGLVWLDCHADFNTPETTATGFFDGYALALVAGDCWGRLCRSVDGFRPLPEERLVLVGARDIDRGERERLEASAVVTVPVDEIAALPRRLAELSGVARVSLHVDLDVLDPSVGRANRWAVSPGLGAAQLLEAVAAVVAAIPLAALTLSAYDPVFDAEGRVRRAALDVLGQVAG